MTSSQKSFSYQTDVANLMKEIMEEAKQLDDDEGNKIPAEGITTDDEAAALFDRTRYLQELIDDLLELLQNEGRIPDHMRELEQSIRESPTVSSDGLAIVVGHTASRAGAVGKFPGGNVSEHPWNKDLAASIKSIAAANGVRSEIFYRDGVGISGAYRNVRRWSPKATVELHFNAVSGRAAGTETLWAKRSESKKWAGALQDKMVALYARHGRLDRGLLDRSGGGRGHGSLTKIHPSALIEPFFGSSREDARLAAAEKTNLAKGIVQAYLELYEGATGTVTAPATPPPPPVVGSLPNEPLFEDLLEAYVKAPIEFPQLKQVTLAQWALESGWGKSELAEKHFNFAGMKWRNQMAGFATKVLYRAHDGTEDYCRFDSLDGFIAGYWHRLDAISAYDGWRDHTATADDFIDYIGGIWVGHSDSHKRNYIRKIKDIGERIGPVGTASAGTVDAGPIDGGPADSGPDTSTQANIAIPPDAALFMQLRDGLSDDSIRHPKLKAAMMAHWALESNWGRSELASRHYNFAGMEWNDLLKELAAPVSHQSSQGTRDYCRFVDLEAFVAGYLTILDGDERFSGWQDHADNGDKFLRFIGPKWRPDDSTYAAKVIGILNRSA